MVEFSTLPPEVVSNVFAFIRKPSDRRNVCLVNRICRDVMLPDMWRYFESDLCCDMTRFNVLVHPKSNILSNIKRFKLLRVPDASETTVTGLQLDRLAIFMLAMPQDRLMSFTSDDCIDSITLRIILQSQRKLEELNVALNEDLGEPSGWTPYLSALTELRLWLAEDPVESNRRLDFCQPLLQQSPKLTSLVISALETSDGSIDPADMSLLHFSKGPSEAEKFDLKSLKLLDIGLGNHYARLSDHINLTTLTEIELVDCLDPQPMIRMLARTFAGGACALEGLSICLASHTAERTDGPGVRGDIEALLLSFQGLKQIFVDMTRYGLLSKDSIINHARTLETWGIGVDKQLQAGTNQLLPVAYEASDLADILRNCEKLTQLALPLGIGTASWEGLCRDIAKLDVIDQDQSQASDLRATLTAVANHPRLHSFRFNDAGFLDWNGDNTTHRWDKERLPDKYVEVAAVAMQNLATDILRFFDEQDSNIRALAWVPSTWMRPIGSDSSRDSNGHRWPEYVWHRGRTIDSQGLSKVVAIPVDIRRDAPESWIFSLP